MVRVHGKEIVQVLGHSGKVRVRVCGGELVGCVVVQVWVQVGGGT